ncbi:hypothetical protein GCM10025794_32530 [Massilia kyonggiensis]|jgi:hypothetical protein
MPSPSSPYTPDYKTKTPMQDDGLGMLHVKGKYTYEVLLGKLQNTPAAVDSCQLGIDSPLVWRGHYYFLTWCGWHGGIGREFDMG